MIIKRPPDIKASEITDKSLYLRRREFLRDTALAGLAVAGLGASARAVAGTGEKLGNVKKSLLSSPGEELTPYEDITTYNNFYEFGTNKEDPAANSGKFKPQPWNVRVGGECNKPGSYALEDFIKPHALEERIYRMRCVEAWSMVIPWVGIPLGDVLKRFEPNGNAKYVAFTTVMRPNEMPGQRRAVLEWPYVEGLRMDEAMHPLTILSIGLYGEVLPNQNGAPLRLVVPWKYGFKGIKSIVKVEFTSRQPPTAWNISNSREYGFYSNVNPQVDHPRWSQGKERRIGEFLKRKTLMFNGYADQVASLYAGMDLQKNY
ncbi:MAG: mononuclear molybdenum enzyme YedY [Gammaproteobacteria bacterium RIFCSPLOWO2_02_FULL_61_13]|nr:MAG: mononuclear molybdenum enzyme YedY [Gammaproteobacteria bacterium RIFCSPLOWO2_02_FULL_61_13]